jgi:hypothetical protein
MEDVARNYGEHKPKDEAAGSEAGAAELLD